MSASQGMDKVCFKSLFPMEYEGLLHMEPKQTRQLSWMVEKLNQANPWQNCPQGLGPGTRACLSCREKWML